MFEEIDNDIEYSNKSRIESQGQDQEKFRTRSAKATRANRRVKKGAGAPGSTRLRRNKHWSW